MRGEANTLPGKRPLGDARAQRREHLRRVGDLHHTVAQAGVARDGFGPGSEVVGVGPGLRAKLGQHCGGARHAEAGVGAKRFVADAEKRPGPGDAVPRGGGAEVQRAQLGRAVGIMNCRVFKRAVIIGRYGIVEARLRPRHRREQVARNRVCVRGPVDRVVEGDRARERRRVDGSVDTAPEQHRENGEEKP